MTEKTGVVITGVSAIAASLDDPVDPSGVRRIPDARIRASLPPDFGQKRKYTRISTIAMSAAYRAILDASNDLFAGDADNVAIAYIGKCSADSEKWEFFDNYVREGWQGARQKVFTDTIPNVPAGRIAIHFGYRGPGITFCGDEKAGSMALRWSFDLLDDRDAKAVIALSAFAPTGAFVAARREMTGAALDVYTEAAAAIVFERIEDVSARGGRPRGEWLDAKSVIRPDRTISTASYNDRGWMLEVAPLYNLCQFLLSEDTTGQTAALRPGAEGSIENITIRRT
jgi:3-oxoacyl-[acyl-carrier-protein] synthase II